MNDRLHLSITQLGHAIEALNEVVAEEPGAKRYIVDATIQRFEFTFELCWKTLKRLLEAKGEKVTFAKEALKKAYQAEWIDDEAVWIQMLDDRNLTSHTYNQDLADEIYERIKSYAPVLTRAFQTIRGL